MRGCAGGGRRGEGERERGRAEQRKGREEREREAEFLWKHMTRMKKE